MLATAPPSFAAAARPVVHAARNAGLGRTIVVDARNRTLYRLSGETTSRLKCTGGCLGFWPPLTVPSARVHLRAGTGVRGRLGVFRRPDGRFQVTLRGMPLYRYSGDSARGDANGQGLQSFGGTWSTLLARAAAGARPQPQPAPQPQPQPAPYTY